MRRQIAAILLLLAISPVTAPCLTLNLGQLICRDAPVIAVVMDARKGHDEPLATAPAAAGTPLFAVAIADTSFTRPSLVLSRPRLQLPLRI